MLCYQKRFPTSLHYTPEAPPGRRATMGGYSRFHHSVLERRELREVGTAVLLSCRGDLRKRRQGGGVFLEILLRHVFESYKSGVQLVLLPLLR